MKKTILHWFFLIIFIVLSFPLYSNIQGIWAFNLVPVIRFFSATAPVPMIITIIVMNFFATLFVAILIALPLGYIVRDKSLLFGFLLSLASILYLISAWLYYSDIALKDFSADIIILRISESISILTTFIIMSKLGEHIRYARERKTK